MSLKIDAIIVAAALCVGAACAFAFRHHIDDWKYQHQTNKNITQTAKNVEKAQKQSVDIEARVAKGQQRAASVRAQLKEHNHQLVENKHVKLKPLSEVTDTPAAPVVPVVVDPSDQLDGHTVCLLNAARAGDAAGAPCGSDAKSAAPSGVDVGTLIDSDADIAGRYNELATRHNALVDWVNEQLARQAKGH